MGIIVGILLGLVALVIGAELVVRGGTAVAAAFAVPPIVIGVTIVSIGTSVPELAVGFDAVSRGEPDLAIGNIAGTNMVNLLLILGLSAILRAIPLQPQTLRIDLPAMVLAAGVLLVFALDGTITSLEGAVLLLGSVVYLLAVLRAARKSGTEVIAEYDEEFSAPPTAHKRSDMVRHLIYLAGGIGLVLLGADKLVNASVEAARAFGVSEAVIGLTVIAIGTSAPELVTTIVSTIKNERDIAIGNLLGSSVLNILFILGATTFAISGDVVVAPELRQVDLPLMFAVSLLCIPVFATRKTMARWEGVLFVSLYVAYLSYLLVVRV
ncbi:MAG: calcium/sodium antiporter [Candidatus Nanopelagicales bacterium]